MVKTRVVHVVAVTAVLMAVFAGRAVAVEHHPKGDYAPFADCPLSMESLSSCIAATIDDGELVVGRSTVPIDARLLLQGGLLEVEDGVAFFGAEDGNTLSKVPLKVPGGLTGLIPPEYLPKSLREMLAHDLSRGTTAVTLTAELAAPATAIDLSLGALILGEGVGLRLPVKVKLGNPFLGANCYLGSSSNPIVLSLTTGTTAPPLPNKELKGHPSSPTGIEGTQGAIAALSDISLVDNGFAAPGASGCGGAFSSAIDAAIDAQLGLPSPAGRNTAILGANVEIAGAIIVREHE
jgi:hypothetical protein